MESQKDFENKVTEFIHRLPPMPGNVEELLNVANVQDMADHHAVWLLARPGERKCHQ